MTTRCALLGHPVAHSRSPAMHNAAYRALALDWRYEAIDVPPERFEATARGLAAERYAGANVTVPHKLRALAVADAASAVARAVGAANTLAFSDAGILADNTDVGGFLAALRERRPSAPEGMSALVLGAGGAGRAVAYALARERAASIAVWNRREERARTLVEELRPHAGGSDLHAVAEPSLDGVELLVNATSVGMTGGDHDADPFKALHLSADKWEDVRVVVDMVYREDGTALSREAAARGLVCVDGIDILVHQGAASFELWTGRSAPLGVMRRAALGRRDEQAGSAP